MLHDPSSDARPSSVCVCVFLWSAEAAALRRGPNRDSLVAGLQEGATDVSFMSEKIGDESDA